MKKKELKNLSIKIAALENNISNGIDVKESENEIMRLMSKLSFEDMMVLDEYLTEILT